MDLHQALNIVDRTLTVQGYSNPTLAKSVSSVTGPAGPHLSEVPQLDNLIKIRAVDVLLRLATASRPRYQVDVLEMQLYWSLMRYLGLFDEMPDGSSRMRLSDAGRRIPGNQRRVTSEEVGIGFAVLIAELWMTTMGGALGARTIDVDVALQDMGGSVIAGGTVKKLVKVGSKRPDYLLLGDVPGKLGAVKIALLECKGTKTPGYHVPQLSSAAHQLQGLTVDGRRPPGLAVSTLLGDRPITFHALESPREPRLRGVYDPVEKPGEAFESEDLDAVQEPAAPIEVDINQIDLRAGNPEIDVSSGAIDSQALARAALQASWASIADFAGNDAAFRRWAPIPMLRRLGRDYQAQRVRTERALPGGLTANGVRNIVNLPGGQLEVFLGLESNVDSALGSDDPQRVVAAQQRLRSVRQDRVEEGQGGDRVASVSNDGSALMFTPM